MKTEVSQTQSEVFTMVICDIVMLFSSALRHVGSNFKISWLIGCNFDMRLYLGLALCTHVLVFLSGLNILIFLTDIQHSLVNF